MKNRVIISKIHKKTQNSKKSRISVQQSINSMRNPRKSTRGKLGSEIGMNHRDSERKNSESSAGLIDLALNNISSKTYYYIFMISQKPLNAIDEEYYVIDDDILKKEILIQPIEFNKLFFFNYKTPGDSSPAKKELPVEDIESIHAILHKTTFNLKLKLCTGKCYYFNFATAIESVYWIDGLRKAITTQEEVMRSKYGVLKYNIGILYKFYEQKKLLELDEVVTNLISNMNDDKDVDTFLDGFETTLKELNYFCDAFYCHKPFVKSLFERLVKNTHSIIRVKLMDFWNKNYLEMIAGEILSFGKAVNKYFILLKYWGVVDTKLKAFNNPVIITFCNRLFDNSKEIMFNVIDEAMFKYRMDNKILVNDSTRILESHINICFENYEQLPTIETALRLVDMIMMIITIVQINLITQIQNPKKPLHEKVLVSLINNDFDGLIQRFMKKIHKKTKSEISLNEIRKIINYEYFQRNNIKMNNKCLDTLNTLISMDITHIYSQLKGSFEQQKIKNFVENFDKIFSEIFFGLKNEFEKFDITDRMCHKLLSLYFESFVSFCSYTTHSAIEKCIKKLEKDKLYLLNYFRPLISNDLDSQIEIISVMKQFLETDDPEIVKVLLLKISAFFGKEEIQEHQMKSLINAKIYFSDDQKEFLKEEFSIIFSENERIKRETKTVKMYIRKLNPKVKIFISKLKKKMREKEDDKLRSTTVNFRPHTTDIMIENFSMDEVFSFNSKCIMIKFPKDIDELKIEDFLCEYLEKKSK